MTVGKIVKDRVRLYCHVLIVQIDQIFKILIVEYKARFFKFYFDCRIFNSLQYNREKPVRKIGSGRIQIDRENSRDYSGLRDRFDERDVRERDVRERDPDREREFAWNRDREHWDRDSRDRDVREAEWDRDRRFDRSERFRRAVDRDFPDRDRVNIIAVLLSPRLVISSHRSRTCPSGARDQPQGSHQCYIERNCMNLEKPRQTINIKRRINVC